MKHEILRAYEQMAKRYNALIDYKPHNAYYDRPNTLSLLPDVKDKNILDAACGPGKYAELLMEKGANVTGFDLSPKMIDFAILRNEGRGAFFVHDLTDPFDRVESGSFDIVLCALALHYIEDWNFTISEFYRALKPGGTLVISIEHPFCEYVFFNSSKYFEVEPVHCTWKGFGQPVVVNSFRRPLGKCIQPLTDNGFYIDTILEPLPTEAFQRSDPRHFEELSNFPAFLCIRAVKRD
ncbi:MAG: class I SAM-dependent DNA methyltransferase [Chitinophagaceae bacterium]